MMVIDIDPVAFSIGPLAVHWYGLMYIVGIVTGLWVAWPYAKYRGITGDQLERIALWAIPAGFVGARLYYVLQQPLGQYLSDPVGIIAVWEGGMAFYGAVFAVVLTIIILTWRMRLSIWKFLDVAVIFGTVGQFFGRIGNIINGDVIGYQTTLPWGFVYKNPNSFPPRHDIAYQPAAVYEAVIDIILFSILWFLRKKVPPGILFFVYIFGYSVSQIIVFIWRDNEVVLLGLKQAQLTAVVVILLAGCAFIWFLNRQTGNQTAGRNQNPQGSI
jgi:phosphatidylglycerol---prolipoprotein diacylglyceryl transferase